MAWQIIDAVPPETKKALIATQEAYPYIKRIIFFFKR